MEYTDSILVVRPRIVSETKLMVFGSSVQFVGTGARCQPPEIGSTLPRRDVRQPVRREHPVEASTTIDAGIRAKFPTSGSNLVTECPLE